LQAGFKPGRKNRSLDDRHLIFGSFSRNIFRGRNRFRLLPNKSGSRF
jgi:hypothetical protein